MDVIFVLGNDVQVCRSVFQMLVSRLFTFVSSFENEHLGHLEELLKYGV